MHLDGGGLLVRTLVDGTGSLRQWSRLVFAVYTAFGQCVYVCVMYLPERVRKIRSVFPLPLPHFYCFWCSVWQQGGSITGLDSVWARVYVNLHSVVDEQEKGGRGELFLSNAHSSTMANCCSAIIVCAASQKKMVVTAGYYNFVFHSLNTSKWGSVRRCLWPATAMREALLYRFLLIMLLLDWKAYRYSKPYDNDCV